jgi:hypothetical protein
MGHLLKIKCVESRVNVHILASASVTFTLTTVQVPILALTHMKRITAHRLKTFFAHRGPVSLLFSHFTSFPETFILFSARGLVIRTFNPFYKRHGVGRSAVPTGGPDVGLRAVPLGPGLRPPQHQPQAGIEPGLPGRTATSGRRLSEEDTPSDPPQAKSRPGDRVGGELLRV